MSGGGGGTTTVQKADPWSGIQPALTALYGNLTGAYNSGQLAPAINTGQQASWTPEMWNALGQSNNANNFATGAAMKLAGGDLQNSGNIGAQGLQGVMSGDFAGGANLKDIAGGNFNNTQAMQLARLAQGQFNGNTATQTLADTASGKYLDANNPALVGMMNAQAQPVVQNFQRATLPGLLSAYSAAGRYGSGANDTAIGAASDSLGQTLANLSANTIGQNYANERQNQLAAGNTLAGLMSGAGNTLLGAQQGAAGTLGGLSQQASSNLASLQGNALSSIPGLAAGNVNNAGMLQDYLQNILNSRINQNNYDSSRTLTGLSNLSGLLQNGMALNGQTSSQSGGVSPFGTALKGGLGGAATGAAIGSVIPGLGTGIGAGVGGALGLLSGLF